MRLTTTATAVLLIMSLASPALGQSDERAFSVQHFQTAPGRDNYLTQEGATVRNHLGFSVGGMLVYQHKPLQIRTCEIEEDGHCEKWSDPLGAVVKHQLVLEALGSFSIFKVFEIGLALPFILYHAGESITDASGAVLVEEPDSHAGLEDIRLHLKLDLLHLFRARTERFGLALVPVLTFPVGNAVASESFMGDSTVTVHPKIAFEVLFERVRFGFNLGYMWRETKEFYMAEMGQRLTYGAALEVFFIPGLSGVFEMFGQSGFAPDLSVNPLEMDGAIRYRFPVGLVLTAGLGGGIVAAAGTPLVRAFAGLVWAPEAKKKAEPKEGGPSDKDGDTIPDDQDQCPKKAEDEDGFQDDDGCPDDDNDGDGIKDKKDKCPDEAEDKDGHDDKDGCPDGDNDGDGIEDADDACPTEPEDEDDFQDDDGCPDEDNDTDGVPDDKDKCPDEKEVYNDFEDDDGCPDEGEALLQVTESQLEIIEKINFGFNSDEIVGDKSFKVLGTIIKIMNANPKWKLKIEGHTDNKGDRDYNLDLSQRRADAVKKYLVDHGIDEKRLKTKGYGPDKPIADNDTKKGRAQNRRVEFHIIKGIW
jgi:outer membrane protein OmpA-like peptidoglycan-associated protein